MRVAGNEESCTVGSHGVKDALVGGMDDSDGQVSIGRCRTGDAVVVVVADVRVVDPDHLQIEPSDAEPKPLVHRTEPTRALESVDQVLSGQPLRCHGLTAAMALGEVAQRILDRCGEVVVGAEHEDPGSIEQRSVGIEHGRHRVHMGHIVAGADHEVRLERPQSPQPFRTVGLARVQVQVGDVQDPHGARARRQNGDGDVPQGKGSGLEHRAVSQHAHPQAERRSSQRGGGG